MLAALVHLSAWQTVAGIRILLPSREAPPPTLEVALLPPAHAPIALPTRRAVVRAARASGKGASLTAVRTDVRSRRREPAAVAPDAAAKAIEPAAVAGAQPEAPAPTAPPTQPQSSPPPSAAAPTTPADHAVATAAPTVPVENSEPPPPASAPASSHPAVQVVLPRSARLVYDSYGTVRAGGFVLRVRGRTTTRWQFRDGHYQLDLNVDVVNFSESSQGQFVPEFGLQPDRYSETRPRHPVATTQFDWVNRRVSFTDGQRQDEAEPGTQDRLSVQFQLSVLRQVYPDLFVRGTVVPITLAGTRDVSHWTFTVTGEDTVDSGLGHLPALRVLSNRTTASGDESLEVWISEKLNWFPVRIRMIDKNRNLLDFVLDEATVDGVAGLAARN